MPRVKPLPEALKESIQDYNDQVFEEIQTRLDRAWVFWERLLTPKQHIRQRYDLYEEAVHESMLDGGMMKYVEPVCFQLQNDPLALYLRIQFPGDQVYRAGRMDNYGADTSFEVPTGFTLNIPFDVQVVATATPLAATRGIQIINSMLAPGKQPLYFSVKATTQGIKLFDSNPFVRLIGWNLRAAE